MTTTTTKSENSKQLKIFAYSTGVALATILLPPTVKLLLAEWLPNAQNSPIVDKAIYPITAALSALYVTWRISVESTVLKDKINKLEQAYETKHWIHQNLVVSGLVDITVKEYKKISDLRSDAGLLLKKITESTIINYSVNQMLKHLDDEEHNKLNIHSSNNKSITTKNKQKIVRSDDVQIGNIVKF